MQQRTVTILCPLCELEFDPKITKTNICPNCLIAQMNITQNITNHPEVIFCRYCRRYQRPPWVLCERDSKELLAICLKKIIGLEGKTLIDAKFLFTEPSSRQIKIQITIQQEVMNGTCIQEVKTLEFKEMYQQCEDCKREFTPHVWSACIQLRQRVDHKKSFYYLEQLILKNHMNESLLKVESGEEGINFYFKQKNQALPMLDFIRHHLPIRVKESKEVYAHIKYTYLVEVPKICKDDLVILPQKLCQQLGGISRIQLCHRVSSYIHLIDPVKLKTSDLTSEKYFQFEIDIVTMPLKENCDEFTILDSEKILWKNDPSNPFSDSMCQVTLMKDDDPEFKQYTIKSHLGKILQAGMTVQGFDLSKQNNELDDIDSKPDLIIVRRKPEKNKKKKVKLQRLEIEEINEKKNKKKEEQEEAQLEEFIQECEDDQEMQKCLITQAE